MNIETLRKTKKKHLILRLNLYGMVVNVKYGFIMMEDDFIIKKPFGCKPGIRRKRNFIGPMKLRERKHI